MLYIHIIGSPKKGTPVLGKPPHRTVGTGEWECRKIGTIQETACGPKGP